MPTSPDRLIVNALWLIRLRWVAVVGQLITIAVVVLVLGVPIQIWPLGIIVGLTAISNFVLQRSFSGQARQRTVDDRSWATWNPVLALVMTMDLLSLTALLYATGGSTNPFSLFFFVNLSLCAVVVTPQWARALNVLSILCFAWLLFDYIPIHARLSWLLIDQVLVDFDMGESMLPISQKGYASILQLGLLVAFATCSTVIVYFMTRLTTALRQQQLDLRRAEIHQIRSEKLEALGTLAAGAAHELATPLSTIAVIAGDVQQEIEKRESASKDDSELVDDVRLIRSELDRCRSILDRMASDAGQTVGESIQSVTVREIWQNVIDGLNSREQIQIRYPEEVNQTVEVPLTGLCQAIRGLLQNAQQASQPHQDILVNLGSEGENWLWTIRDHGKGMSDKVLKRVSEPFFTTKQPGEGMGLGVYLAQNVLRRLGGSVKLESVPGVGTKVEIRLPKQR